MSGSENKNWAIAIAHDFWLSDAILEWAKWVSAGVESDEYWFQIPYRIETTFFITTEISGIL